MKDSRAAFLAAFALLAMFATAVWAQGVPVRDSVVVIAPDGGLGVRPPVLVSSDGGFGVVLNSPLEALPDGGVALGVAIPEPVRVVGPTFGEVFISGTVNLSSATLASMGNFICTAAESHRLSLTTTPTIIPSGAPIANRTSWTLINQDSVKKVSCRVDPGDGGVPDCSTPGFGITVQPNGGRLTFPVRDTDTVRCVACVTGATVEHTEEACVAP